jgi:hypothetical protein
VIATKVAKLISDAAIAPAAWTTVFVAIRAVSVDSTAADGSGRLPLAVTDPQSFAEWGRAAAVAPKPARE